MNESYVNEKLRILKSIDKKTGTDLSVATEDDIINIHFFFPKTWPSQQKMSTNLIEKCTNQTSNCIEILHKIFPDHIRDANSVYYMNSLFFLMALEKEIDTLDWLPPWLVKGRERTIANTIKGLITHTMSYFAQEEARKTVLLSAYSFRRLIKLWIYIKPKQDELDHLQHLQHIFSQSQFSWQEILSSPLQVKLQNFDTFALLSVKNFVREFTDENNNFKEDLAKQRLKEMWELECLLFEKNPDYWEKRKESNIGELNPTQVSSVTYDSLGHSCLCAIETFPKWKDYCLEMYQEELQLHANMGSWAACKILNEANIDYSSDIYDSELAKRFFFGDTDLFNTLKRNYTHR